MILILCYQLVGSCDRVPSYEPHYSIKYENFSLSELKMARVIHYTKMTNVTTDTSATILFTDSSTKQVVLIKLIDLK